MSNKNIGFSPKRAVLALALFAVAIGITTFLYRRNAKPIQEVSMQEPIVESLNLEIPESQSTEVMAPIPSSVPSAPPAAAQERQEPDTTQPSSQATPPKALKTAYPVSGDTIGGYAMDCLSYNETTRDWRTHNGIDLAAEDGAPVCAAADGTVYTTYEDDTFGNTVVIRHEGGYTTRYASLGDELCVQPGDSVTLGQTIGYAGDSALVETVMGSHVHFSVSYQDLPMDPMEFLALS